MDINQLYKNHKEEIQKLKGNINLLIKLNNFANEEFKKIREDINNLEKLFIEDELRVEDFESFRNKYWKKTLNSSAKK